MKSSRKFGCAVLLAGLAMLLCGSASHYEFDLPELYGCRTVGLDPAALRFVRTVEPDGNGCAELSATGRGTLAGDAVVLIGVTRAAPGARLDYELNVKGDFADVVLRPVAWRENEPPQPVPGAAETRLRPTAAWRTQKGSFEVPPHAQFTALALFLPKGTPLRPGAALRVDKVRLADRAGMNLYTHLTFVEPSPSGAEAKKTGEYVVLFKGNSITRHGFNTDTIQRLNWDHIAGMAASEERLDYPHQLCDRIAGALPGRSVRPVFGRGNQGALADLARERALRPDLIILQGGEHNTTDAEIAGYRAYLLETVAALRAFPGRPPVILVGIWDAHNGKSYPPDSRAGRIQQIQRAVSTEIGVPLVSVEAFAGDPACRGWGTHDGVKWHPNDAGMRQYAEAIFAVWRTLPKGGR